MTSPSAQAGWVDVPGARLWYVDPFPSQGQAVVLVHANTGTSLSWAHQLESFGLAGHRVIAFDRRGWGRSEPRPETGAQPGTFAEDLTGLLDALDLDQVDLVATAGGVFGALDFAAALPQRVRSLVAAASVGAFDEPEIREFTARIRISQLRGDTPPVYREVSAGFRGEHPEATRHWIEIERQARRAGTVDQDTLAPLTFATIARITAPTLVLAGGADLISPPALMRRWAAHLPRADFEIIAEAGHSIAYEAPKQFDDLVLGFLRRVVQRPSSLLTRVTCAESTGSATT
jgi:pimeloyl-ACP methyl ester carboxylesterase